MGWRQDPVPPASNPHISVSNKLLAPKHTAPFYLHSQEWQRTSRGLLRHWQVPHPALKPQTSQSRMVPWESGKMCQAKTGEGVFTKCSLGTLKARSSQETATGPSSTDPDNHSVSKRKTMFEAAPPKGNGYQTCMKACLPPTPDPRKRRRAVPKPC